jgi:hypothetical protein
LSDPYLDTPELERQGVGTHPKRPPTARGIHPQLSCHQHGDRTGIHVLPLCYRDDYKGRGTVRENDLDVGSPGTERQNAENPQSQEYDAPTTRMPSGTFSPRATHTFFSKTLILSVTQTLQIVNQPSEIQDISS